MSEEKPENPKRNLMPIDQNEIRKWNKIASLIFLVITILFLFIAIFLKGMAIFFLPGLGTLMISIFLYRKD
jgi:uncharacterized membrane protein